MIRYSLLSIVIFISLQAFGQAPIAIERKSDLKFELKKSSKKTFSLALKADDILNVRSQAEGSVNFKIIDPGGQVIYQNLVNNQLAEWQKSIDTEGIYSVEVESTALLFKTRVSIALSLIRNNFTYGHPSMETLVSARSIKELVDGEFQIKRNTPQAYNYTVQKGDTLIFRLRPVTGNSPEIEIKNDLNELLYSSFPSKREQFVQIPILQAGTYSINMASDAYFPQKNYLKVELYSPSRYDKLPEPEPKNTNEEGGNDLIQSFDTIPEVYMDTIIFLGAKRDIINLNKQLLKFQFDEPSNIIKWMVLYGSGKEFFDQVNEMSGLLTSEIMAKGATNILAAYGLGAIKQLPKSSDEKIIFTPSSSILYGMRSPLIRNYASLDNVYGDHSLLMENKSESSGQKVYVQVVIFRQIEPENQ